MQSCSGQAYAVLHAGEIVDFCKQSVLALAYEPRFNELCFFSLVRAGYDGVTRYKPYRILLVLDHRRKIAQEWNKWKKWKDPPRLSLTLN